VGADDRADLGDEEGLGAHHLAAALDETLSIVGIADVLDDPGVVAVVLELLRVLDETLEDAASGPNPLDRRDLVVEGEDRLDLQGRAHPGAGGADPAAATQVLERVDREPHPQVLPCRADALDDGLDRLAGLGRRDRREDEHPHPTAAGAAVDHMDALASAALVDQPLAGLRRRLVGAGDPGCEMDRDDRPAGVEERPVDLDEVADRRLRGRRSLVARPQPLEERSVVADLALLALLAGDRHVEADLLHPMLLEQRVREVGGRVADDRDIPWGAHRRPLYHLPGKQRPSPHYHPDRWPGPW
jgi:hypothetical protein